MRGTKKHFREESGINEPLCVTGGKIEKQAGLDTYQQYHISPRGYSLDRPSWVMLLMCITVGTSWRLQQFSRAHMTGPIFYFCLRHEKPFTVSVPWFLEKQ